MAPTGRHGRVVPIPCNSIENSLRKLVKIFERDPTVRSRDTDLLTRCFGAVGGKAPSGRRRRVVQSRRYSIEYSPLNLVQKNLRAIQWSDL